jgi:hypothetical protein
MIASYFLVLARVRAAEGISKEPGTRMISISSSFAPERTSASWALRSNLSVMNSLKRETTMPNFLPAALRLPSIALV